ncbi:hypothetical protein CANCADRAFT_30088 [Tortispora caseinolytica NRRL Y-17796]|uniref:BAH domain-containing protein n=1 Tax=Tortispora caseinolytica NRRL Y-17796 TaxID=767744 RepID=A0A1E4TJ18_9ASCO|nr:hypothetical protein CANCADRAFT_30088 [Tortispora caseinolytica NRRL Y-17796]
MSDRAAIVQSLINVIYNLEDADGRNVSEIFYDLPPKELKDYYELIKTPIALNVIRSKAKTPGYSVPQLVSDISQMVYNAKLYNMKTSIVYQDAEVVDNVLKSELQKLVRQGKITSTEARIPQLGPLPDSEESDDDSSEDEYNDDGDDDDDDRQTKRRRTRPTSQIAQRPPAVGRPHELKIKAVLSGIRGARDNNGRFLSTAFESLPDPNQLPEYYSVIRAPIALDTIRYAIRRRQYPNFETFLADMRRMFENAKIYNRDDSQIYKDAEVLGNRLEELAADESKRIDSTPVNRLIEGTNGRPTRIVMDHVEHRGEVYRIGDWIHIVNLNDPSKPTVAQIFRIWQDEEGRRWINACWYFRPEQTVHRYDRLFWENEVFKSARYQNHLVDEIAGKCAVMFITKYTRGRPKNVGNKQVYLCECRYNEREKTFSKIRTWKAALPEEARAESDNIDFFESLRPVPKFVSPLKHLLPSNATDDMPVPDSKQGDGNAPPIIGAVYKRPYDPVADQGVYNPNPDEAALNPMASARSTHIYRNNDSAAKSYASQSSGMSSGHIDGEDEYGRYKNYRNSDAGFSDSGTPGRNSFGSGSGMAGQGGEWGGHSYNTMRGGNSQHYIPPVPPSTFTISEQDLKGINPYTRSCMLRDKDSQPLFFSSPPTELGNINVRRGRDFALNSPKDAYPMHSLAYLKFKSSKLRP